MGGPQHGGGEENGGGGQECQEDATFEGEFLRRGEGGGLGGFEGGFDEAFFRRGSDWRGAKDGELLEEFYRRDAGKGGDAGGEKGGADDDGGLFGALSGEDGDGGSRDELDGAGVDGEEGTHRVGGGAGMWVEPFEMAHGAEAEWGGGVAEAEHVGCHVEEHGAHGGMTFGDVWEKSAHQGMEGAGQESDEAGEFGQTEEAEPKGHEAG